MTIEDLKDKKLRPRGDLVAFKWIRPRLKSGIIIPESYYDLGLQLGKFYIGEIIAIGSKVKTLKPKTNILIAEYGIKDFRGTWNEKEIYFIEEKFIKAIISGYKGLIERTMTKEEAKKA